MSIFGGRGAVDEAVLAELRAIRGEISRLTERIGQAATREDLDDYATKDELQAHLDDHKSHVEGWRWWLAYVVTGVLGFIQLMQMAGVTVRLGH